MSDSTSGTHTANFWEREAFQDPLDSKTRETGLSTTYQQMLQLEPSEQGLVESIRRCYARTHHVSGVSGGLKKEKKTARTHTENHWECGVPRVFLDSKAWKTGSRTTYQQMLQLEPLELGWVESIGRLPTARIMQGRIMCLYVDGEIRGGKDRVSRANLLSVLLDLLDGCQDVSEYLEWGEISQSLREADAIEVKRQCQDLEAPLEAEKAND
ncbi:hypothetical protein L211DRAFT_870078 [Terfezia boudieri ATCC MYA-4762]|uniref:Uncharacterized protein n=1 Tax=Terfezia boudieri ATCC MYA-4762 TaxID=1051890 RepID=A0A3N4LIC9_9PEZI|nr:hypothetical protein L211DRAFT_870078 [Terfezia boudieri ATCC MYA-4762]